MARKQFTERVPAPNDNQPQPQDSESGLVERSWVRTSTSRRRGTLTERSLEGEEVTASFLDRHGHLQRASGHVIRTAAGKLAIESWADGIRQETPVPRDASVDVKGR